MEGKVWVFTNNSKTAQQLHVVRQYGAPAKHTQKAVLVTVLISDVVALGKR